MNCDSISNPLMDIGQLIASVNNPPGQPFQDIQIQTSQRTDGGQVGGPGKGNSNGNSGNGNSGNGNSGNGQEIGQGAGTGQGAVGQNLGVRILSGGYMDARMATVLMIACIIVSW